MLCFLLPIAVIEITKYNNISVYSINSGGYTFNITPPSPLSSECIMFSAYRSVHACDRQTRNTSVIVKTFVITQETPSATCRQSDKTTSSFATLIRLYVFPRLKQFSGVRSRLYEGRPSHKNNSETYKNILFYQ